MEDNEICKVYLQQPSILHSNHSLVENAYVFYMMDLCSFARLSLRFSRSWQTWSMCSIIRSCITCRFRAPRLRLQMMKQLPLERVTPDAVFDQTRLSPPTLSLTCVSLFQWWLRQFTWSLSQIYQLTVFFFVGEHSSENLPYVERPWH